MGTCDEAPRLLNSSRLIARLIATFFDDLQILIAKLIATFFDDLQSFLVRQYVSLVRQNHASGEIYKVT